MDVFIYSGTHFVKFLLLQDFHMCMFNVFFFTDNCTLQFHGISYLNISEQFAITISKTLPPGSASASEITLVHQNNQLLNCQWSKQDTYFNISICWMQDKIMSLKGCSVGNPCSRLIHFWIPLQILVDFAWEWWSLLIKEL